MDPRVVRARVPPSPSNPSLTLPHPPPSARTTAAVSFDDLCKDPATGTLPAGLTPAQYSDLKVQLSQTLAEKKLTMSDFAGQLGDFKVGRHAFRVVPARTGNERG